MFGFLFLLFIGLPLLELYLLLNIGSQLGAFNTFAIVLITGFAGAYLAKSQGQSVFMQTQNELRQGGVPADSLIQGLLVFVGGLLLITPGFVTDAFGFFFVIPMTRNLLIEVLKKHFKKAVASGRYKVYQSGSSGFPGGGGFRVYTYSNHSRGNSDTFHGARPIRDVNPEVIDQKGED